METIENITEMTCANKIKYMRQIVVPLEYQMCRTCQFYESEYFCPYYIPLKDNHDKKVESKR